MVLYLTQVIPRRQTGGTRVSMVRGTASENPRSASLAAMEARKICVLGDFATGKTSLVARFVHDSFLTTYHTTVGVKVDARDLVLADGRARRLAIWDVAGTGTPTELFLRYLRGASGYLLVADATRAETLERALEIRAAVESLLPAIPSVNLVNKVDLAERQELDEVRVARLAGAGEGWLRGSARTGENVERAFARLLERMERAA
jgi:small GTP-binding protein